MKKILIIVVVAAILLAPVLHRDSTGDPHTLAERITRVGFFDKLGDKLKHHDDEGEAKKPAQKSRTVFTPEKNKRMVTVDDGQHIYILFSDHYRHLIPNREVFNWYGLKSNQVDKIDQKDLDKYQEVRLLVVQDGDAAPIYYLNDDGSLLQVATRSTLSTYDFDNLKPLLKVNAQELASYTPVSAYVYISDDLSHDVFKLEGNTKRYVTNVVLVRLGLTQDKMTPMTKTQLDTYASGTPLL